jgi:hypothetical protein
LGSFNIVSFDLQNYTFKQISATTRFNIDSSTLALMHMSENPGDDRVTSQSGYTSSKNKKDNWIASDVVSGVSKGIYTQVGLEALFFHELGNMVANLLGQGIKSGNSNDPTGDRDKGQEFENCLYGGRVGLRTGRLGNSREL